MAEEHEHSVYLSRKEVKRLQKTLKQYLEETKSLKQYLEETK